MGVCLSVCGPLCNIRRNDKLWALKEPIMTSDVTRRFEVNYYYNNRQFFTFLTIFSYFITLFSNVSHFLRSNLLIVYPKQSLSLQEAS